MHFIQLSTIKKKYGEKYENKGGWVGVCCMKSSKFSNGDKNMYTGKFCDLLD